MIGGTEEDRSLCNSAQVYSLSGPLCAHSSAPGVAFAPRLADAAVSSLVWSRGPLRPYGCVVRAVMSTLSSRPRRRRSRQRDVVRALLVLALCVCVA